MIISTTTVAVVQKLSIITKQLHDLPWITGTGFGGIKDALWDFH